MCVALPTQFFEKKEIDLLFLLLFFFYTFLKKMTRGATASLRAIPESQLNSQFQPPPNTSLPVVPSAHENAVQCWHQNLKQLIKHCFSFSAKRDYKRVERPKHDKAMGKRQMHFTF